MSTPKHAIMLVAGEGKRLLPFTLQDPKCFARVGGTRILDNALRALQANGCERVTIVVGHHAERVRREITERFAGMSVRFVENADYAKTNSMFSLALGLEGVDEATWVLEGDIFLEPAVLAVDSAAEIGWLVDSSLRGLDGAFVEADESGVARDLSIVRDLRLLRPRQSKSVGILKLTARGAAELRAWLREGVAAGRQNVYYDLIIGDHLQTGNVSVVDVAGRKWFEIDSHADLEAATKLFAGGR